MNSFYRKLKITLILMCICLIWSCINQNDPILIHPLQSESEAFSFQITKTIPLSNKNESLIGGVDQMMIYKGKIYVLDKRQVSSVLIFSIDGTLVKRIPRGKGPGELIHVQSFNILNNELVISDQADMKYYSLNGEFHFTKHLPEGWYAWSFLGSDNNKVLIHGSATLKNSNESNKFIKYHIVDDKFSECFASYYTINRDFLPLVEQQPISYYSGKYLLLARPTNYIYELDGSDFYVKYLVDFESFSFLDSEIAQGRDYIFSLFQNGKRYGFLDNIYENSTLVHFTYFTWFDGKGHIVPIIYSKVQKKAANLYDIFSNSDLPRLTVSQMLGDQLICYFSPNDLTESEINHYNKSQYSSQPITKNSNPIVTIIEIFPRN